MKKDWLKRRLPLFVMTVAFLFPVLLAPDAFAEEGTSTGRKIWDNVMLFVNFGILVFLFIKYAKDPFMKYLHGVRGKIAEEFERINSEKENAESARDGEATKLQDVDGYLEEIKDNIVQMGEREKAKIIEEGRLSAEKMIKDAQEYAANRVKLARKALADEMVDLAVSMVEEKLKTALTEEDNDRMIDQFVTDLSGAPDVIK